MNRPFGLAIVGHVDHGKSTLMGRLLHETESLPDGFVDTLKHQCDMLGQEFSYAFVLDQFEEERRRKITIDTTQKQFSIGDRRFVVIDTPGHVEFLKNTITGASHADGALIVVSGVDGVEEQTRRHIYVLGMLGISNIVVAITKMDLMDGDSYQRFCDVGDAVLELLDEVGISTDNDIIPVSGKTGENITEGNVPSWWGKTDLLTALGRLKNTAADATAALRATVQLTYNDWVLGKVLNGSVKEGDGLTFWNVGGGSSNCQVTSVYSKSLRGSGEHIALQVDQMDKIERGAVLTARNGLPPRVTKIVDAVIFWMGNRSWVGEHLMMCCGTASVPIRITEVRSKFDPATLEPISDANVIAETEVAEVEIMLDYPIVVASFDETPGLSRFVIRRGVDTVAGGIIR